MCSMGVVSKRVLAVRTSDSIFMCFCNVRANIKMSFKNDKFYKKCRFLKTNHLSGCQSADGFLFRSDCREDEVEAGAFARFGADTELAAHGFGKTLADSKT